MLSLVFLNESKAYEVSFQQISKNIVQLVGEFPHNTDGFTLSRMEKNDNWDYSTYTTIYRELENGVQYSNDGTVYVEPEPIPEETVPELEPYVPTLEEIRTMKISDAYVGKEDVWLQGYKVITSNGIETFNLTEAERNYIPTLLSQYHSGADKIAFYSNESNGWIFYTRDDIGKILEAMESLVLKENAYCEDYVKWLNDLETKEEIESRYYGESLPEKYKSEVTISFEN